MLKKGSSNHSPRPRYCQLILVIMYLSGDRDGQQQTVEFQLRVRSSLKGTPIVHRDRLALIANLGHRTL
jgi:hypothetical protein